MVIITYKNNTQHPKGFWTRETVISEIQRLNELGLDLSPSNIRREYGSLYTKALSIVGNWREAIELSGLVYEDVIKTRENGYWTKDKIYQQIKDLKSRDFDFSTVNTLVHESELYRSAVKIIGSWRLALRDCSIDYRDYERKRENGYWSKKKVDEELQNLVKNGSDMSLKAVTNTKQGLSKAAIRIYGTWENAIESLGLDYDDIRLDYESQNYFGYVLERKVFELLNELQIPFKQQTNEFRKVVPDIVFLDGSIFDIKLSNYTDVKGRKTVKKYGKYATNIGIIFLRGDFSSDEYILNDVVFRHVTYYTKLLPEIRRKHYDNYFNDILKRARSASVLINKRNSSKTK